MPGKALARNLFFIGDAQLIVHIPSPLRSYTLNKSQVEGKGASVGDVLADLDTRYPGIRFRMIDEQSGIRQHIKIFVNTKQAQSISVPVTNTDVVHIICALSGG